MQKTSYADRRHTRARQTVYERVVRRLKRFYRVTATVPPRLMNVLVHNREALRSDVRYIFILSHMRCYTSLLSHVLGSHPEISGYYEQHRSYRSSIDLFFMKLDIADGLDYQFRGRFALDKILHSGHLLAPKILQREDVFTIFCLRKPEPAIKSIASLPAIQTAELATGYYISRLRDLGELVEIPKHKAYFDGEDLVRVPEPTLQKLQNYLGLREPISRSYETFRHTGRRGFGDPSPNIQSRNIISDTSASHYAQVGISPEMLADAVETYTIVREKLQRVCVAS